MWEKKETERDPAGEPHRDQKEIRKKGKKNLRRGWSAEAPSDLVCPGEKTLGGDSFEKVPTTKGERIGGSQERGT